MFVLQAASSLLNSIIIVINLASELSESVRSQTVTLREERLLLKCTVLKTLDELYQRQTKSDPTIKDVNTWTLVYWQVQLHHRYNTCEINNETLQSAKVLSKECCLVVSSRTSIISKPALLGWKHAKGSVWAIIYQHFTVNDLLLLDSKLILHQILSTLRRSTPFFEDELHLLVCVFVEELSYCSRIMSPNTPKSFIKPQKTKEC